MLFRRWLLDGGGERWKRGGVAGVEKGVFVLVVIVVVVSNLAGMMMKKPLQWWWCSAGYRQRLLSSFLQQAAFLRS